MQLVDMSYPGLMVISNVPPFRLLIIWKFQNCFSPSFHSSISQLKNAYEDLNMVHKGDDAMRIFSELGNLTDIEQIEKYRAALLEYCKLDTYAMVKTLEKLRCLAA